MTEPRIIVVTGWRRWPADHHAVITDELDRIYFNCHTDQRLIVRHGANPDGVDHITDQWCHRTPRAVAERYPAEWDRHEPDCGPRHPRCRGTGWCRRAGDRRNRIMAHQHPPAHDARAWPGPPGPSGTRNAMRHLREAGIPGLHLPWEQLTAGPPYHYLPL